MITSIHNHKVKQFQQWLSQSRVRKESNVLILEGVRLIETAINAGYRPEIVLFSSILNERGQQVLKKMIHSEIIEVDASILERVSDTETSQGLMASLTKFELDLPPAADLLLILDGIQDPGNAGTLLRSALGAGAQGVIFTPGGVDPFSPKVLRSGMGAHFRLPIRTYAHSEIIERYHENAHWWTTDIKGGLPYYQVDMTKPSVLIIGSEAAGVSSELSTLCEGAITIPVSDDIESLNAAIAGSIIMFEARRQRLT